MAWDEENMLLYTGGRDATIRQWNASNKTSLEHSYCLQLHTNWVNDLKLCDNNTKLISCSSDCTVVIRDLSQNDINSSYDYCTINHLDYVKKTTCTYIGGESNELTVISGGLDGHVYCHAVDPQFHIKLLHKYDTKHSIYALAVNKPTLENGSTLIASGGPSQSIKIFNPKSSSDEYTAKLKGHADTIKSLMFTKDGNSLISGGSDGVLKIWDLRMMKCLSNMMIHHDSIWSIVPSPNLSTEIFTGSRDGSVFKVDSKSLSHCLVIKEENPILSLVVSKDTAKEGRLFASTTSSQVNEWMFSNEEVSSLMTRSLNTFVSSPTSSIKIVNRNAPGESIEDAHIVRSTAGRVALTDKRILNDKRHILTRDQLGVVKMWDIFDIGHYEDFGVTDFEKKYEELNEKKFIPSWFRVDITSGSLIATMTPSSTAILANTYDLGFKDVDQSVNMGQLLLQNIFKSVQPNTDSKAYDKVKVNVPNWVWVSIDQNGRSLARIAPHELTDSGILPRWVDLALVGKIQVPKSPVSIHILPHDDSNKVEARITGEPHFLISKIAAYILGKLKEEIRTNLKNSTEEVRVKAKSSTEEPVALAKHHIELLCKDQVVPLTTSIRTVKTFYWRSSDMEMTFRINPEYELYIEEN